MAAYYDYFIIPVRKSKVDDYKKVARKMGKLWIEFGAIEYHETLADDVPYGKVTSIPRGVDRKNSETVVIGWALYKSKAQRDKANKKLMEDPRVQKMMQGTDAIFDASRMTWGGFSEIVSIST